MTDTFDLLKGQTDKKFEGWIYPKGILTTSLEFSNTLLVTELSHINFYNSYIYPKSKVIYQIQGIKIDALYLGKMAYIVKIKKMKLPGPWHILSIIVSRLSTGLWKENDFIKGGNLNWNSSHSLYRLTIKPEIESSTTTKISP